MEKGGVDSAQVPQLSLYIYIYIYVYTCTYPPTPCGSGRVDAPYSSSNNKKTKIGQIMSDRVC